MDSSILLVVLLLQPVLGLVLVGPSCTTSTTTISSFCLFCFPSYTTSTSGVVLLVYSSPSY